MKNGERIKLMKTVIFYFSGTGNSLKVARDLAVAISDTEIMAIPKALRNQEFNWSHFDNIGFVFPVYFEGPPLMVNEFVKKLVLTDKKYLFAVATYGAVFGDVLKILNRSLPDGQSLNLGETIQMPGNYLAWYGAWEEQKQKNAFEHQNEAVKAIARSIKAQETKPLKRDRFIYNLFTKFWYPQFEKEAKTRDQHFSVDATCNGCQICKRLCPANNISFDSGKPQWNGRCEQCFACIQWCPQEAIQYGKKTRNRKRYHHPEITVQDLFVD